jgi:hypothetical protein
VLKKEKKERKKKRKRGSNKRSGSENPASGATGIDDVGKPVVGQHHQFQIKKKGIYI